MAEERIDVSVSSAAVLELIAVAVAVTPFVFIVADAAGARLRQSEPRRSHPTYQLQVNPVIQLKNHKINE